MYVYILLVYVCKTQICLIHPVVPLPQSRSNLAFLPPCSHLSAHTVSSGGISSKLAIYMTPAPSRVGSCRMTCAVLPTTGTRTMRMRIASRPSKLSTGARTQHRHHHRAMPPKIDNTADRHRHIHRCGSPQPRSLP